MTTSVEKRLDRKDRATNQRHSWGRVLGAVAALGLAAGAMVTGCGMEESANPEGASEPTAKVEAALTNDVHGGTTVFRKTSVTVGTCDMYGKGCYVDTRWTPVTNNSCSATQTSGTVYSDAITGIADCQSLGTTLLNEFKRRHPDGGEVSVSTTSSAATACPICDGPQCCYTAGTAPAYGGGTTAITKCVDAGASTLCPSTGGVCKTVGQAFDLNDISFCQVTLTVAPCNTRTDGKQTSCSNTCQNTTNDVKNCGGCGVTCRGDQTCTAGKCVCQDSSKTDCGNVCASLSSDNAHCGSCSNYCRGDLFCSSGQCTCPSGETNCGNGVCIGDFSSDNNNCGGCGIRCGSGQHCSGSRCVCNEQCNGVCTHFDSDSNNCGGCGNVCSGGTQCCSGKCIGVSSDPRNCGGCGRACNYATGYGAQLITNSCSGASTCENGSCRALGGYSYCRTCDWVKTEIDNILAGSQDEAYTCAWRTGTNCTFAAGKCSF